MGLTEEAANKIAQRYNSDLIAELSDEIAALERENELVLSILMPDEETENASLKGYRCAVCNAFLSRRMQTGANHYDGCIVGRIVDTLLTEQVA